MNTNELYINYNGELLAANEPCITVHNRAFMYGDGVFESMHAYAGEVQFFDRHFHRLENALKVLCIEPNKHITYENIAFEIDRLLKRNKLYNGARVRLTVFRNSTGLYRPIENSAAFVIEANPLNYKFYKLNEKGLTIGLYTELKKPNNKLSAFKTCNAILNVMAGVYAQQHQFDDCLVLNESNEIIEGYHSNLFVVKDSCLYTPPIESGCVDGIMRSVIIKLAHQLKIKVDSHFKVTETHLLNADEIFLTNAVEGIRWVLAYKNRRYFNRIARMLNDALNTMLFSTKI